MFPPGWSIWWILLTLRLSACDVEIYYYNNHEVICSEGISECTMEDVKSLDEEVNNNVVIQNLTPSVKLCCKDHDVFCALCLVIDTEIFEDLEDEGPSGYDEENPKASVTVCYKTTPVMPMCKKVEFTINTTALYEKKTVSIVILKPLGVFFESKVMVYTSKFETSQFLVKEVVAPSLKQVCRQELQQHVVDCHVPRLNIEMNKESNNVDLKFTDGTKPLPSVCIQYEKNGACQRWNKTTIPLYSVAPCMCFQVWKEDDETPMRSLKCPFTNNSNFKRKILQNVSVSVGQGQRNSYGPMLLWNLSAPCRLEGEVWPCHNKNSCREKRGFRQKLGVGKWRQNRKRLWENKGVFEDDFSTCVMVTIEGQDLGPFCLNNTDRWHWSLLAVGVLLLICLTALIFYFLHVYIKKWVWSWNHGGFVKVSRKGHVVLLSPPDVDDHVSELVCQLGSHICNQGFSVSVDQWSRKEQCTLGPLPWLHSQLLKLNSRVVLVLTNKALEKVEEWAHQPKQDIKAKEDDNGVPQIWSPYSDVFTAALCIIQAEKQLGKDQRFLLVKFDSHLGGGRLPKLLQGVPLFQLPSQTQTLLAELTMGGTKRRSVGRRWTGWKWMTSDKWRGTTRPAQGIPI
ncbi:interleukin-17 receptor C-like [Anabas testudineus]|uniref:SEFIR domain-containing protein n=1 Tax=Anabas testudineus TaxID=64144 RepID=A0A3Q1HZG4_ANATE|nr:interleukin-17 receptor C-like [Anabas testudineus]